MKTSLLALTLVVALGGLAGCSGGSNSNAGGGGPPVVTPPPPGPAIDTRFETFVKAILASTSETGSPVSINQSDFTFTENFSAYSDLFGS
ncbi:MAG: hypothetical protein ABIR16_02930 [Dokdonella sp.]